MLFVHIYKEFKKGVFLALFGVFPGGPKKGDFGPQKGVKKWSFWGPCFWPFLEKKHHSGTGKSHGIRHLLGTPGPKTGVFGAPDTRFWGLFGVPPGKP